MTEVGFWYKGSVRRTVVLPIYERTALHVELVAYQVKVFNNRRAAIVEDGISIEDALFGIHKKLEDRPGFFD